MQSTDASASQQASAQLYFGNRNHRPLGQHHQGRRFASCRRRQRNGAGSHLLDASNDRMGLGVRSACCPHSLTTIHPRLGNPKRHTCPRPSHIGHDLEVQLPHTPNDNAIMLASDAQGRVVNGQLAHGRKDTRGMVRHIRLKGHRQDRRRKLRKGQHHRLLGIADRVPGRRFLEAGERHDVTREGLIDTPKRVAKAYKELFSGYDQDAEEELGRTFEEVAGYDDIVLIKDIPFFSHCEHHMVPIIGKAHVAYLPDGKVLGLSKIARVVDIFARRLQTQEAMTAQIAASIQDVLNPRGVAVMIEAEHMCMAMRGIRQQGSTTTTMTFTGAFRDSPEEQVRFISLVRAAGGK